MIISKDSIDIHICPNNAKIVIPKKDKKYRTNYPFACEYREYCNYKTLINNEAYCGFGRNNVNFDKKHK